MAAGASAIHKRKPLTRVGVGQFHQMSVSSLMVTGLVRDGGVFSFAAAINPTAVAVRKVSEVLSFSLHKRWRVWWSQQTLFSKFFPPPLRRNVIKLCVRYGTQISTSLLWNPSKLVQYLPSSWWRSLKTASSSWTLPDKGDQANLLDCWYSPGTFGQPALLENSLE